jgi:hypothetical protein
MDQILRTRELRGGVSKAGTAETNGTAAKNSGWQGWAETTAWAGQGACATDGETVVWFMILQRGFMGLEGWQHFMGPTMCRIEQLFMEEKPGWQVEQGDRATKTPNIKTIRFRMRSDFFIVESYALFPEFAKERLIECFYIER